MWTNINKIDTYVIEGGKFLILSSPAGTPHAKKNFSKIAGSKTIVMLRNFDNLT